MIASLHLKKFCELPGNYFKSATHRNAEVAYMVDIQKDHFSQKVTTDANGTEPTADTGEPVLDSGASRHILRSERYFDVTTLKTCHIPINTAGKQQLVATQTGDAKLTLAAPNGKPYDLMLQNALHLPESRRGLVGVGAEVWSIKACSAEILELQPDNAWRRSAEAIVQRVLRNWYSSNDGELEFRLLCVWVHVGKLRLRVCELALKKGGEERVELGLLETKDMDEEMLSLSSEEVTLTTVGLLELVLVKSSPRAVMSSTSIAA